MARYTKEFVIGSGTFGTVWLVKSKLSQESFVLKEINLNSLSEKEQAQALTEVSVLAKCKHKHIIRYKGASVDGEKKILSLIMEYAIGGDLHSAILNQGGNPFSEHRVLTWFVEICLALQYIHHKNILHRDLKSQNLFLTHNNAIKLGDFGIARVLNGPDELAKTAIGTPLYLSPEICQRKRYDYKSDIWALGCVLFEMAALELPFAGQDFFHLMSMILEGKRKRLPKHCSFLIRDMVDSLLTLDHEQRPNAGEILARPELQPYLSAYLLKENSKEEMMTLSSTKSGSSARRRGASKQEFPDIGAKRKAMTPIQNKEPAKRSVSWQRETASEKNRCITPTSKSSQKILPPVKNAKSVPKPPIAMYNSVKSRSGLGETPKRGFTVSYDTYVLSDVSINEQSSPLIRSDDARFGEEFDYGYQSETPTNITPMTRFHRSIKSSNSKSTLPKTQDIKPPTVCDDVSEYMRTYSTSDLSKNLEMLHSHCSHSQCQQCMLDMLWRNRIRSQNKTPVNTNEYLLLKKKLLSIFKNKFGEVHQSLICDWEDGNISSSSDVLGSIASSLSYEQAQSLPLMMQLVQLDFLMKIDQN